MPSHDVSGRTSAVRSCRHVWANDLKQPISPSEMRTGARAFQRVELLAEREILEDQFAMSAASQRQPSHECNDQ